MTLTRFWFKLPKTAANSYITIGCGVTAYDYDDALNLIRSNFDGLEIPSQPEYVENIDVSTLDQKHVIPNMGISSVRGIWFPKI